MMKSNQWISGQMVGRCSALVIVSCLFASFILLAPNYCSAVSIRGSAITLGQGFEDSEGEDHFNLAQGLRIHAYQLGLDELSFHGYFQYYGDLSNDFADEGKFRLYHGYLSYKKRDFPLNIRAGRFFLFRGVAVGVLDGGEFTYKINPQWSFTGFGGVQGPLSREWEFNPGGNSPMFGGEVRWLPGKFRGLKPSFSLSYTRQEREGDLLRHLLGLSIYLRVSRKWSSLNGEDVPVCADCHGKHDIRPSTDQRSRVHPINLPETCGRCHEDLDLIKKHEIYVQKPIEIYESSVHGKASLGGIYVAATCNDCHSVGGTAHRILSPGDPESPINHFNVPHT